MTLAGGLLEIVWAAGLKITYDRFAAFSDANVQAQGQAQPWTETAGALVALAVTLAAILGSFDLLTRACKTLPVGTVYAAFAGIGSVGTAVVGIAGFGEPVSAVKLVLIALLTVLIVALKRTEDRVKDARIENGRR